MIKAIIFDIGGILYSGKREDFYYRLQELLRIKDNSFAVLFEKNFNELLLGKKSFLKLSDELNLKMPVSEFENKAREAWLETFKVQKEMVDLIKVLGKSYTVCCLSNASDFDVLMDKETKVDMLFDTYINSCNTKSKKPELKIYQMTLDKLELKAEECVFIDDREEYLGPARKLGINTILFENAEVLKLDLGRLGVEVIGNLSVS